MTDQDKIIMDDEGLYHYQYEHMSFDECMKVSLNIIEWFKKRPFLDEETRNEVLFEEDGIRKVVDHKEILVFMLHWLSRAVHQCLMKPSDVFMLVTTYGMPVELVADVAHEHGLEVDRNAHEFLMRQHRENSRNVNLPNRKHS